MTSTRPTQHRPRPPRPLPSRRLPSRPQRLHLWCDVIAASGRPQPQVRARAHHPPVFAAWSLLTPQFSRSGDLLPLQQPVTSHIRQRQCPAPLHAAHCSLLMPRPGVITTIGHDDWTCMATLRTGTLSPSHPRCFFLVDDVLAPGADLTQHQPILMPHPRQRQRLARSVIVSSTTATLGGRLPATTTDNWPHILPPSVTSKTHKRLRLWVCACDYLLHLYLLRHSVHKFI